MNPRIWEYLTKKPEFPEAGSICREIAQFEIAVPVESRELAQPYRPKKTLQPSERSTEDCGNNYL